MKTFITARMDQSQIKRLRNAGFKVEQGGFAITGEKMAKDELVSKLSDVEVAIIEFEAISQEVINAAKNLKIIATCRNEPAANTDIDAATARNIPVLFTPGRNAVAVAEYTLGLMISIARSIPTSHHLLRYTDDLTSVSYPDKAGDRRGITSEWSLDPDAPFQRFQGDELMGKTVGIVGAGFIGQEIAKRVFALGMQVVAFDPYVKSDQLGKLSIKSVELEELVRISDYVVMAAKVTSESTGLFSAKYFDLMKPTAYFINTARAALVDYEVLLKVLKTNKIAGAALDVYPTEPLPGDSGFRSLSNVVLSPHLGGASKQVVSHHSKMVVDDLLGLLKGEIPNRVANKVAMDNFMKSGGLK